MIAGLPWSAWLLLLVAVGLGLAVELIFYFNHRCRRRRSPARLPDRDQPELLNGS
ncbi:MAG: hypothetical protein ACE5HV_07880 [Acidobacteriota bacterium]